MRHNQGNLSVIHESVISVSRSKSRHHQSLRMLHETSVAIRKTVKEKIEAVTPFFSSYLLLTAVCILSILQIIPLAFDSIIPSSLDHQFNYPLVDKTTGFTLGFISLIFMDITYDAIYRRIESSELWVSRSIYFWTTLIHTIIIFNSKSIGIGVGLIYILFNKTTLIFFIGRAFVDLCLYDSTNTWNMKQCIGVLSLLSASQIITSIATLSKSYSTQILHYLGLILAILYSLSIILYSILCLSRIFHKYSGINFKTKFLKFTHHDYISLVTVSTLIICSIPLSIIPSFIPINTYNASYICGELIIRLFLVTSLALFSSLSLKHKAFSLEADLNLRSIFVKNVAHEIRTPLNIAISGLDIIRRTADINKHYEERDMIIEIQDSCEEAVAILDELLCYEKLASGVMKLDKHRTNIRYFVMKAVALFNIQARSKNIDMSILQNDNLIDESAEFDIDYGKMTQVLRNFISNAIKFTPDHGTILVNAFYRENQVSLVNIGSRKSLSAVIQVVDSGVGMTKEQLSKIFSEIVQFDANKNQNGKGSGIGLWVSKKMVDLHGGKVKVSSEGLGFGCTFEVEIPLHIPSKSDIESDKNHNIDNHSNDKSISNRAVVIGSFIGPTLYSHTTPLHPDIRHVNSQHAIISRMIDSHHSSSTSSKISIGMQNKKLGGSILDGISEQSLSVKPKPRPSMQMNSGIFLSEKVYANTEKASIFENMHILIVDDSSINRKFLRKLISPCRFIVEEAGDGVLCIEKVSDPKRTITEMFDFILMDCEMPIMNGLKATEELRKRKYEGAIIGVTGNSMAEDIQAFLESGADDVLVKPVTYNQLIACLTEILKRRHPLPIIEGYDDEDKIERIV